MHYTFKTILHVDAIQCTMNSPYAYMHITYHFNMTVIYCKYAYSATVKVAIIICYEDIDIFIM